MSVTEGTSRAHILERTPAGDRIHGIPAVRRCLLVACRPVALHTAEIVTEQILGAD
jgi:hypothetical protein